MDAKDIIYRILEPYGFWDLKEAIGRFNLSTTENNEVGYIAYDKDGKRYKMRVGKWIKKYFPFQYTSNGDSIPLSDKEIMTLSGEIIGTIWGVQDVVEYRGEDLRRMYHVKNSGVPSCMAHGYAQEYLDIYVDNPDIVSLAFVRVGDKAARALIWTIDGVRYMDRIYHTSQAAKAALELYAERNNIEEDDNPPDVEMKIRNGLESYWPYMDTMSCMTLISEDRCRLSCEVGKYKLNFTEGRIGCNCDGCGDSCFEDDLIYSEFLDQSFCQYCYTERHFFCECCETDQPNDDGRGTHDGMACESCLEEHYIFCEICEEYFYHDDIKEVDGECYCTHCYDQKVKACANCSDEHHEDDMIEINGDSYCTDCVCEQCKTVFKGSVCQCTAEEA